MNWWLDGLMGPSLTPFQTAHVNSPFMIGDADIHTHSTLPLIWSPLYSTCVAHLPSNVSVVYLWSMDMRSTRHHAPSRTSPHGSPVAPPASLPPTYRPPTNHPSNDDSSLLKVFCKTSSSKSLITSTAASCSRGSTNPEIG